MKTARFQFFNGAVVLLTLLAGLAKVDGQVVQLSFPLNTGFFTNPWTAPIVSVFDHAMQQRYTSNGIVVAYTGETGTIQDPNEPPAQDNGQLLYSYKKADLSSFIINGHYWGTVTTGSNTLNYDGHPGYDYPVAIGTPVYAAADGVVLNAVPTDSDSSGKYIQITHTGTSYLSEYLHLSEVDVTNNQSVLRGDLIGLSGNSGGVAPHLHFETKINVAGVWISVDPYGWQGSGSDPYTNATNLCLWAAASGQTFTNVMSPVVSYQYYDSFGEDTNATVISPIASYQYYDVLNEDTNSAIVSPIVSYQYFDSLDASSVNFLNSPLVSYYYPTLNEPPLTIIPTNRVPTSFELSSFFILPSQLEVFQNGAYESIGAFVDTNAMTIVLTHGWIPTVTVAGVEVTQFGVEGVDGWPTDYANQLRTNGVTANIVTWNWDDDSKSSIDKPGDAAERTPDQGIKLGKALLNVLGPNYSRPIHFIGHSLGTLVNSYAANYLQGTNFAKTEEVSPTPWPATNMQMTLFDEAEVAMGITSFGTDIDTLSGRNGNPFLPKKSYDNPLPKQFAWADNYIAAVGLLQTNAANVILTNGFPANAPNPISWFINFADFHAYPYGWYEETIEPDVSAMGFLWSFERGGWFSQAPSEGSVYVQAFNNSQWDLTATNWTYGTNLLNARFQAYRNGLFYSLTGETLAQAAVNGNGSGQNVVDALPAFESAYDSFILSIFTTAANTPPTSQFKVRPLGLSANDESSSTNVPAYAWMPLVVPANAVSLSFDYIIQGDWQSDSLASAFNGTNVLLIAGNTIQTNVMFSSGSIDVSVFAGQTNELFIGIVGGTSTNAQLTVENLAFLISSPPSLQAQANRGSLTLSWPMSSQNFSLQTTTNLADPNSWITLTNVPAIVNLQNTITNPIDGSQGFYRLIQSQ